MIGNQKIICTVGFGNHFNPDNILKLKNGGADFIRINLSHTLKKDLEENIKKLKKLNAPIMLDTEGCQIRTGNSKELFFKEGTIIKIYDQEIICNDQTLFFNPGKIIYKLKVGDLLHPDFNSVLLRICDISKKEKGGYVEAIVLIGGKIGCKKGVHLEIDFKLPVFSDKDLYSFKLAKKYNINSFSLSFIHNANEISLFKKLNPNVKYTVKIETKEAVKNLNSILNNCDSILIDRGDLSRVVPLEKIPFIQKKILKKANTKNVNAFIASNTLEEMSFALKPNRAEVNDIFNALNLGCNGFVLTKETAIGKHPIETLNLLKAIIKEFESKDPLDPFASRLIIEPHGGKLINRFNPELKENLKNLKRINIDLETLMDLKQISNGAFSPLKGFLSKGDFDSVLKNMRLKNGIIWPLPIILQIKKKGNLKKGDKIRLDYQNETYALLKLKDIYKLKNSDIKKWFGTLSLEHPGVEMVKEKGAFALGGEITLILKKETKDNLYELTPKQTRKIFMERGWSNILGFHTRNVIHRSHEFIQLEGLRKSFCDGLLVHPVVGKKKKGDFEKEAIIESYDLMINKFYPKGKVIFSILNTYSRYGGPREALFTALIRKNYGCNFFIVGRDHTGVKNFYPKTASQKIFDKFSLKEFGITPIKFDNVFYSKSKKEYLPNTDFKGDEKDKMSISGTQAREIFKRKKLPPRWFMRPEISKMILKRIKKKKKVFVE